MFKIKADTIAGGANVATGGLATALRSVLQIQARSAASSVAALTDNSGGAAADGTVGAIPLCTTTPATGATCPTKTEVETAFGTVKDALTEIGAKIAAYATAVPAFTPTNSIGGAAADGTIAAITVAFTGATTGRVAKTGFNAVVADVTALIAQLGNDVNALATAVGVAELDLSAVTATDYTHTYAALATSTGTAAADGTASVDDTEAEASMTAIAAAVKELATKLNALRTGSVAITAVAA
jgi:hypothetical protein